MLWSDLIAHVGHTYGLNVYVARCSVLYLDGFAVKLNPDVF